MSRILEMSNANAEPNDVTVHKKEMPGQIEADAKDQQTIVDKLETCIDPMNPDDNPSSLLNIVAGMLTTESVNVDEAVAFGKRQWKDYEGRLSDGFYSAITKVVTMAVGKKTSVKLGSDFIFDTELIYSRTIGLIPSYLNRSF